MEWSGCLRRFARKKVMMKSDEFYASNSVTLMKDAAVNMNATEGVDSTHTIALFHSNSIAEL